MQKVHCNVQKYYHPVCCLIMLEQFIRQLTGRVIRKCILLYFYNRMLCLYFFLHSFFLLTLLGIHIDTASKDISEDGSYHFRSHKNNLLQLCYKKVQSQRFLLSFLLTLQCRMFCFLMLFSFSCFWSFILVTHGFQLALFLLSEMFPFCWQLISSKRCPLLHLFTMPTYPTQSFLVPISFY